MTAPPGRATIQLGYLAPDLDAACHALHELLGIGPFLRIAPRPRHRVRHRGRPLDGELVTEAALAQSGDVMIEVLRQVSDVPSAYRDMFEAHESGLHHAAVWSDDYAADLRRHAAACHEIAMEMDVREGLTVGYVDTRASLGHMIELLPRDPSIEALFALVRREAEDWDGRDLVRPMPPRG